MHRFAADRMVGRLARMLRLVGYDTIYLPALDPAGLAEVARREERIILTRGETSRRFPHAPKIFRVESEYPPEQFREVVQQFSLDPRSGLWTRCTVCNGAIAPVAKETVQSLVKPKVFELYNEFFRCSECGRVYWHGSHVERILKNLSWVLGRDL
jgi:uncharacterized protein with PIN domain